MGLIVAVLHGNYKFFIFMAHAPSIDNFDRLMEIMLPFSAGIELTYIETSAYRNSECIHAVAKLRDSFVVIGLLSSGYPPHAFRKIFRYFNL